MHTSPAGPGSALTLSGVCKRFGSVLANDGVTLDVKAGDIHGIVGENGAGKSTLVSIIYGFYSADSGEIKIRDRAVQIRRSQQAIALGIGMVHQHFMLIDRFTVLENILLGVENGLLLRTSEARAREQLKQLQAQYGLHVPLRATVESLPVGVQQRVEILKALYRGADILILDEPTGVLTPQETDDLFHILRALKSQGVTTLLITHKLREIMAITDRVSVMRQGKMIAHRNTKETSLDELAELMVGRKLRPALQKPALPSADARLQVHGLSVVSLGVTRVNKVSFSVHAGEIVGIAGVTGNGQSELLEALSGITPVSHGSFCIGKTRVSANRQTSPAKLRQAGLAHVPEDRHKTGLVLSFSAEESAILGYHRSKYYNHCLLTNAAAIRSGYSDKSRKYDIRPPDPKLRTGGFSGGNQQKIVLAREIEANPDVLLIGQPTRGVDIGAIEFIHQELITLRNAGKAILIVSVELEEIMSLADRILVMCDGQITGELHAESADEKTLGLMMANATPANASH